MIHTPTQATRHTPGRPDMRFCLMLGALMVLVFQAAAQAPTAPDQVDSVQQRRLAEQMARSHSAEGEPVPELFPGESSDVGPQSVLRSKPRRTYIEAQADAQYFYTDNMLLTEHNRQEAAVLVSTAQAALAPTAYELGPGLFSPRLGYRHQWFDFGLDGSKLRNSFLKLNAFDFNAQSPFTDAQWLYKNWVFEAGFEFNRLMTTAEYVEFYREYVPHWGLQRLMPLGERTVISLGYAGDYRSTEGQTFFEKDFNDRTDHSFFAICTHTLCSQAVAQAYYQFKYTSFTAQTQREDYLQSFGLALYCYLTPQINLRAFVGYEMKSSDGRNAIQEYDKLDAGGGVNLTFRF